MDQETIDEGYRLQEEIKADLLPILQKYRDRKDLFGLSESTVCVLSAFMTTLVDCTHLSLARLVGEYAKMRLKQDMEARSKLN